MTTEKMLRAMQMAMYHNGRAAALKVAADAADAITRTFALPDDARQALLGFSAALLAQHASAQVAALEFQNRLDAGQ